MYPFDIVFGLTMYDILLCAAIVVAFIVFSILADMHKIKVKVQRFAVICGVAAVVLGYGSAVLFQALYNIKSNDGVFEITATTGATFYGGLVGGIAVFLILFFGLGWIFFKDMRHAKSFFKIANSAIPGIALGHSLGRIGCLFAGCCHGAPTDAWYGINMMNGSGEWVKCVPTQLFEAIFLMLLFGFLVSFSILKKKLILPFYLIIYGVWRFAIEYLRDDYRGDTFIEALTPSQLIALVLVVIGIALIFVEVAVTKYIAGLEKNETERKNESNA